MADPEQLIDRLLLVYDADAGRLAAVLDSARKLFALDACELCTITHGLTGERPSWSACKNDLGVPVAGLHRDELSGELLTATAGRLPCVVAETPAGPRVLVERADFGACHRDPRELAALIRQRARTERLLLPASTL
jgi:hypothetical protein